MASIFIQQAYGDGTTTTFPFTYTILTPKDVVVTIDGADEGSWDLTPDNQSIILKWPPKAGALVTIERYTDETPLVDFIGGAVLLTNSINLSQMQTVHIAEEADDLANACILFNPRINVYDAVNHVISNVGLCLTAEDVATKAYLTPVLNSLVFVRPTPATIAAAIATLTALLVTMEAEWVLVHGPEGDRDACDADLAAMQLILNELNAWVLNPPPDGATIVARIDAYTGSTVWRTPVTPPGGLDQTFDVSGTWIKPTGTFALVEVWGGGGAGNSFASAVRAYGAGSCCSTVQPGGGGGGYSRKLFKLTDLPSSVAVTVGLGGTPSYAYTDYGRDGGNSSFGAYLGAYGGNSARSPYGSGAGGGPISRSTAMAYPTQGINGWQQGPGPRLPYNVSIGFTFGVTPQSRNAPYGGVTNLSYTENFASCGQGDGGYHYPMVGWQVCSILPQPGVQIGGGGGLPGTRGDGGSVQGMNGAGSVHGGGGGGSGLSIPANQGSSTYYILGRAPGSAGFLQKAIVNPTVFPQGAGGTSQGGGNGGNGGAQGQNGYDGAVPGGGGGGAGIAAGNWNNVAYGPTGGRGGHGRVRVTVW